VAEVKQQHEMHLAETQSINQSINQGTAVMYDLSYSSYVQDAK
jgi:hypothetical protein